MESLKKDIKKFIKENLLRDSTAEKDSEYISKILPILDGLTNDEAYDILSKCKRYVSARAIYKVNDK